MFFEQLGPTLPNTLPAFPWTNSHGSPPTPALDVTPNDFQTWSALAPPWAGKIEESPHVEG